MPKKYTGLTIEQHKKLGKQLKELLSLHHEILNTVQSAYGKSSRVGVAVRSFIKIDTLTRELDAMVCRETTKEEWDQNNYGKIYY